MKVGAKLPGDGFVMVKIVSPWLDHSAQIFVNYSSGWFCGYGFGWD